MTLEGSKNWLRVVWILAMAVCALVVLGFIGVALFS